MTAAQHPYSRVYWRIVDDEKFIGVYDDDRALATWLRLLVLADGCYPAPPPIPRTVHRPSLKKLVDHGIVDLAPGDKFRIHGMQHEREERTRWGQQMVSRRTDRTTEPYNEPVLREVEQDETSLDKTRLDEPRVAPAPEVDDTDDHLDAYYRLTASWPSPKVLPWLNELAAAHGSSALSKALAEECQADPDRSTLLSRTQTRLDREAHQVEKSRKEWERRKVEEERRLIEEMPEEQKAANLQRLRDILVEHGLA